MNELMKIGGKGEAAAFYTRHTNTIKGESEKKIFENEVVESEVCELEELTSLLRNVNLEFSVNDELNCVVIKVVDSKTKDLIREIPSADMQKLKISLRRTIGLIFDETM